MVEAMQTHPQHTHVQRGGCKALGDLCCGDDAAAPARQQRAAEAGAIEALVEAMQTHPQHTYVQHWGCKVLGDLCCGDDAAALARKQRVMEAGAIEAVVEAVDHQDHKQHFRSWSVQKHACRMLGNVCWGEDAAALARRQRVAEVGALEALVEAMQARPQDEGLQEQGCALLRIMCWDDDASGQARRQRVMETSLEAVARAEEIEAVATAEGGGRW